MELPVFVFEGGDLSVFESVTDAEGGNEVYDLDTLRFLNAEGTVLLATADGYRVRLTPTSLRQPEELRTRLDAYLRHPRINMDPSLANDPPRLAALLTDRERTQARPRWPK